MRQWLLLHCIVAEAAATPRRAGCFLHACQARWACQASQARPDAASLPHCSCQVHPACLPRPACITEAVPCCTSSGASHSCVVMFCRCLLFCCCVCNAGQRAYAAALQRVCKDAAGPRRQDERAGAALHHAAQAPEGWCLHCLHCLHVLACLAAWLLACLAACVLACVRACLLACTGGAAVRTRGGSLAWLEQSWASGSAGCSGVLPKTPTQADDFFC